MTYACFTWPPKLAKEPWLGSTCGFIIVAVAVVVVVVAFVGDVVAVLITSVMLCMHVPTRVYGSTEHPCSPILPTALPWAACGRPPQALKVRAAAPSPAALTCPVCH